MVSGCGADGSALPWGGRGRWFKSSHSDQRDAGPNSLLGSALFLSVIKHRNHRNQIHIHSIESKIARLGDMFYYKR